MRNQIAKKILLLILLALAVVAIAFFYRAERKPRSAPALQSQAASTAPALEEAPGTSELQRLPARAVPLRESLPQLSQLANDGHGQAACRLAAEFQRCAGLALSEQEHDRWLASRRRGLEAVAVSANADLLSEFSSAFEVELAKREGLLEKLRIHCDGIRPLGALAQINEWRRAALLGDPTAVRQYASGSMFLRSNFVEASAAMPTYRAEAESMALKLAKQGDLEMMLVLAASYSPNPAQFKPLLSQVVKPDAAMSWALYQRAKKSLDVRNDNDAKTLAATIGFQIELLEQAAKPEHRAAFTQTEAQLDAAWNPVRPAFRRYVSAEGEVPAAKSVDCDRTY